jgi:hypothetical protein
LDKDDLHHVNARFYDENRQPIQKDLSDKVLTINIDQHSFINQPDPLIGRLIDDDFDDMQEDIRNRTVTFLTCPLIHSKNQMSTEHTVKSPIQALMMKLSRHPSCVLQ